MQYPLVQEIDYIDPVELFASFQNQTGAIFLDSAQGIPHCGEFSFIAIEPFQILTAKNTIILCNDIITHGDPFLILATELSKFKLETLPDLPPFQGGVAGYFGYELLQHLENIKLAKIDDLKFDDLKIGFYDLVIAFDLTKKQAWIFSSGYPQQEKTTRKIHAEVRLNYLLAKINLIKQDYQIKPQKKIINNNPVEKNFTKLNYEAAVEKVINYILAGDIFEANISQRFQSVLPASLAPWDLYLNLREINPAPFAAYLNFSDTIVACASPERFLKLTDDAIETRPIKGTRRRSKDLAEDAALAQDLLHSTKDHAENVMIVDLLRNDLSQVCIDSSVQVTKLCGLESFATVHHLVSIVTGKLLLNYGAIDLLRATFPGGSITGAPKVRAMQIIATIEPTRRGPYCGCIAYIGFNGDMDSAITIRTFAMKNNIVTWQAGGAIVADSNPLDEYNETLTKGRALLTALKGPDYDFTN